MARLTWREVAAPNLDVSGFGDAANSFNQSMDRVRQIFVDRDKRLNTKAQEGALAQLMQLGTPEEINAFLQSAPGQFGGEGSRVNLAELMKAGRAYESQRIETGKNQEELLTLQAQGEFSDEIAEINSRYAKGEVEAGDALMAELRQNAQFGRALAGKEDMFGNTQGDWQTRDQTRRRDESQADYQRRMASVAAMNAQTSRMEANARMAEHQRRLQEERESQEAFQLARQLSTTMPRGVSTDDVLTQALNGDMLKGRSANFIEKFGNYLTNPTMGRDRVLQPTEAQRNAGATGNVPAYLLPNAPQDRMPGSINEVSSALSSLIPEIEATEAALVNRAYASDPARAAYANVSKYADITLPKMLDELAGNGLSKDEVERQWRASGLSMPEFRAAFDSHNFTDANLWSRDSMNQGARAYFFRAEDRLKETMPKLRDAFHDKGQTDRWRADEQRLRAGPQALLQRAQALEARLNRGDTSPEVQAAVIQLQQEFAALRELQKLGDKK